MVRFNHGGKTMNFRGFALSIGFAACALVALPGCETWYVGGSSGGFHSGVGVHNSGPAHRPNTTVAHRTGPPPHAPAHGYRAKHGSHNTELVFDSGLGAYLVAGTTDVYFYGDSYFRWTGASWEVSVDFDGPWHYTSDSKVPKRLKEKHGHGKKKNKRARHEDRDDDDSDDDDDDHPGRGQGKNKNRR